LKFPGTSVPIFHYPSALDDEFDDFEAPVLSSIVADEDDIDFDIDGFIDNNISMEPIETLTQSQLVEFKALKLSSTQSFATAYDSLGCCTLSKHKIILDSRTPIYSNQYRKSIKERSIFQYEVRKVLDANIIRLSRSPYASPVILVPKKDNSNSNEC
jgi:hypothetical protein